MASRETPYDEQRETGTDLPEDERESGLSKEQRERVGSKPDDSERDGGLREHTHSTGVQEGYINSEHVQETSGMRHGPEELEERRKRADEAREGAYDRLPSERTGEPDRSSTTSMTEFERHIEEREGGKLLARTPHEMSQHELIERSKDDVEKHDEDGTAGHG